MEHKNLNKEEDAQLGIGAVIGSPSKLILYKRPS